MLTWCWIVNDLQNSLEPIETGKCKTDEIKSNGAKCYKDLYSCPSAWCNTQPVWGCFVWKDIVFFCKKSKRTAERRTIFPVFLSSIFMSKINVFLSVIIWSMSIWTKNLDLKFLHQHSVLSLIVLHSSEQLRPLSEFATSNIFEQ